MYVCVVNRTVSKPNGPSMSSHQAPGFWASFLAQYPYSLVAAATAEAVTFPLDMATTRLQVQGEMELRGGASLTTPPPT